MLSILSAPSVLCTHPRPLQPRMRVSGSQRAVCAVPEDREVYYHPIDHDAVQKARRPFRPNVGDHGKIGLEPIYTESFDYLGIDQGENKTAEDYPVVTPEQASTHPQLIKQLDSACQHLWQARDDPLPTQAALHVDQAMHCLENAKALVEPEALRFPAKPSLVVQSDDAHLKGSGANCGEQNDMFDDVGATEIDV